jgi:uncharacterized membrane-anchored protein YhcB (DUF1043 family)
MEPIIDAEKLVVSTEQRLQLKYDALLDQYIKIEKDLDLVAEDRDKYKREVSQHYKSSEMNRVLFHEEKERSDLYAKIINFIIDTVE